MRSLPSRGVALLCWAIACAGACSVDESGLGTSNKLSHDAGLTATGGGPAVGQGGSTPLGTGGTAISTGGNASGGDSSGGNSSGGSTGTGSGGVGGDRAGTGGSPSGTGGSAIGTGGSSVGTGGATGGTGGSNADTGGSTGAGGTSDTGAGGGASGGASGGSAGQGAGGVAGSGTGGAGGGLAGSGGAAGGQGTGGEVGPGGAGGHGGSGEHCSPTSCMGCCLGSVCVTALSAQQCGTHGAACAVCGPCQVCSTAGSCAVDPSSQWTIVAAGAQVAMSPPAGGTWDPAHGDEGGAAPDLFCEYENPAGDVTLTTAGVTSTVVDAYSASWNQTITPSGVTVSASALMAAKPAWRIWVGDEDCPRTNVCNTGQIVCTYQQPFTAAQLMSGSASITNLQSCTSLDLTLVCASGS